MPTTENRVLNQPIILTVNGFQVELPSLRARVSVIAQSEDEFSTVLRGLLALPGAEAPRAVAGTAAVVAIGDMEVLLLAPTSIRDKRVELVASPALDAAIADAVNVTGAAA